jgi:thioredoxin 1
MRRLVMAGGGGLAFGGALLLAACGGGGSPTSSSDPTPATPAGPSAITILDSSNFDAVVSETDVCLVEFFHPSCSHCQRMQPIVEQLAGAFDGRAVVGQVDVTASPEITSAWGVRGYPTFVFLKDSREFDRELGEQSYETLATILQTALDTP